MNNPYLHNDAEHILEYGHPKDVACLYYERRFARALRLYGRKNSGGPSANLICTPVTSSELQRAQDMIKAIRHDELIALLNCALADHDDHNGRILDPRSTHWSAKAHQYFHGTTKPNSNDQDHNSSRETKELGFITIVLTAMLAIGLLLLSGYKALELFDSNNSPHYSHRH